MNLFLKPRLNYCFNIKDVMFSIYSLFNENKDKHEIYKLFETEDIYFTNQARTALKIVLNSLSLKEAVRF